MQTLHKNLRQLCERLSGGYAGAVLLQLLVPGLGHFFRRERLFGLFVYLIHLLAVILVALSLVAGTSRLTLIVVIVLPLAFYFFSFVDLWRIITRGKRLVAPATRTFTILTLLGLLHQVFAPVGLFNIVWANRPAIYRMESAGFAPYFSAGALVWANRVSYGFSSTLFERPFVHSLPRRYDFVRVTDQYGRKTTAIVIGLPGERISMVNGTVVANDLFDPYEPNSERIAGGDSEPRDVSSVAILVARLSAGIVDSLYEVELQNIEGKVCKLL